MKVHELIKRLQDLPLDSDIVVFCACHCDDVLEHHIDSADSYANVITGEPVVRLHIGDNVSWR